jgi:hypothetical protein
MLPLGSRGLAAVRAEGAVLSLQFSAGRRSVSVLGQHHHRFLSPSVALAITRLSSRSRGRCEGAFET